jgi:hypothetical protein
METLKNFVVVTIAVTFVLVLGSLLTQRVSAVNNPKLPAFYLTKTEHTGDQALIACAAGFHMASMWEVIDPSNLGYDNSLGFRNPNQDSSGAPSGKSGWIATGTESVAAGLPGETNCSSWSSSSSSDELLGTAASLELVWNSTATAVSPWHAWTFTCNTRQRVWCIED